MRRCVRPWDKGGLPPVLRVAVFTQSPSVFTHVGRVDAEVGPVALLGSSGMPASRIPYGTADGPRSQKAFKPPRPRGGHGQRCPHSGIPRAALPYHALARGSDAAAAQEAAHPAEKILAGHLDGEE